MYAETYVGTTHDDVYVEGIACECCVVAPRGGDL
jgi:hypothetical protein